MTRDPIERLSSRLFDAARSDAPAEGAERRLLAAALREAREAEPARTGSLRGGVTWAVVTTAAVLAAGIALHVARQNPSDPISAEPERKRATPKRAAAPAESAPAASAPPVPVLAPTAPKPPLSAPLPSASAPVTLSDELDALKVASSSLSAGNAQAALAALDRYDHVLKGSKLRAEATLLRIQALARAGDARAASDLAQRFVDQNPDSPLVDRARSFIQTAGLGGN